MPMAPFQVCILYAAFNHLPWWWGFGFFVFETESFYVAQLNAWLTIRQIWL